jgi:hypothetical protein
MTARYRRSCWTRYHPREATTRTIISRSLPVVVDHPSTAHSIGRQFSKCKCKCRILKRDIGDKICASICCGDEWHLGTNLTMMMMMMFSHMCWRIASHHITNGVPDLNHHTVHIVVHCSSYHHHHFRIDPLHIHFSTEIVDNFEKSECEVVGLHDPLYHLIVMVAE